MSVGRNPAKTVAAAAVLGPQDCAAPAEWPGLGGPTTPLLEGEGPVDSIPAPGTHIGQYEIIREIDRGGMGVVCLARDTKLGRRVAIKFILSGSRALAARFLVEAQTTARCHHENIVVIHEINDHHGLPYMVLEYLEGDPLSQHLEEGRPIPAARAVEIVVPVLRALVAAHELGIVHRDLKPSNIFITRSGTIKVLDFGVAKLFFDDRSGAPAAADRDAEAARPGRLEELPLLHSYVTLSSPGGAVGTLMYMAPEQWGRGTVDNRADLWAIGVLLFQMLTGIHPLGDVSSEELRGRVEDLDRPLPGVSSRAPDLPAHLGQIVDRCLAKRQELRYQHAHELLADLEEHLPGRSGRRLSEDESPFPGLSPFQEGDAHRFFGRSEEIVRAQAWLRDHPLVGVVGPSGAGKSSFVRAGLVPALKTTEPWEVLVMRPGKSPMTNLVNALSGRTWKDDAFEAGEETIAQRLRGEPGTLGRLLRKRAADRRTRILLFVDQFEELYTLVPDPAERAAFTAALAGAADDPGSPIRVILSMRSDFLDRTAEDPRFLDELMRGLMFLPPANRKGLREALTQPAEMAGYRFEVTEIVSEMLAELDSTAGALPLLQFAASRLWEERDRERKLLTRASYQAMGGVAGALASHADRVIGGLTPAVRRLAGEVFQRLVTPERTRAIASVAELQELSPDPTAVRHLLDHLVDARLLVVQARGEAEGAAVEIVHESLINSWPTLRRWLEEGQEDAAFVAQLGTAARQWHAKGRPAGLLWRGEAMEEARRFRKRHRGELAPREREYLQAVESLATRSTRVRRAAMTGALAFLAIVATAAAIALLTIRRAERAARRAETAALAQAEVAGNEAGRARAAEQRSKEQLLLVQTKEQERRRAQEQADQARTEVETSNAELEGAYERLRASFREAEQARHRAESAAQAANRARDAERQATAAMEKLLDREREHVVRLERERKKIGTELR